MFRHKEHYNPRQILILDISALFASAAWAVLLYFQSSYLAGIFGVAWVGPIFVIISLSMVLTALPLLHWGITRSLTHAIALVITVSIASLIGLAWLKNPWAVFVLFVLYSVAYFLLLIYLDVLTEAFSKDNLTGTIRAIKLTLYNIPIALAPLVAGYLMERWGISLLFFISAALLLPVLLFLDGLTAQKRLPTVRYQKFSQAVARLVHDPALSRITFVALLLQFFYGIMVVYTPMYLLVNSYSVSQIGSLMFIILLPFVIFELPAGRIADLWLGEKELFILGIILAGIGTMLFAVVPVLSFGSVVLFLFISRIGASLIEIMRDSAFYKHIAAKDTTLIGLMWIISPLGYLLASLVGTLILSYGTYTELFFTTGVLFFFAIPAIATLKDTK